MPCIGLDRPARPLTVFGLLEPENLLLPRPTGVRRGAQTIPIRDRLALRSSLWVGVGTRTAARGGLKEGVALAEIPQAGSLPPLLQGTARPAAAGGRPYALNRTALYQGLKEDGP